mgnify:CR=1 FL=1
MGCGRLDEEGMVVMTRCRCDPGNGLGAVVPCWWIVCWVGDESGGASQSACPGQVCGQGIGYQVSIIQRSDCGSSLIRAAREQMLDE